MSDVIQRATTTAANFLQRYHGKSSSQPRETVEDTDQVLLTGLRTVEVLLGDGTGDDCGALYTAARRLAKGTPAQQLGCLAAVAAITAGPGQVAQAALQVAGAYAPEAKEEVCDGARSVLLQCAQRNTDAGAFTSALCLASPTAAIALRELSAFGSGLGGGLTRTAAQSCQAIEEGFRRGTCLLEQAREADNALKQAAQVGASRGEVQAALVAQALEAAGTAPPERIPETFHHLGALKAVSLLAEAQQSPSAAARAILDVGPDQISPDNQSFYYQAAAAALGSLTPQEGLAAAVLKGTQSPKMALTILANS